jgi:hypothetical protein
LNRFISRSAERNLPFLEVLKSAKVSQWGAIQQKAFEELKQYLIELTTLTPPSSGTILLLYVAASHTAVSAALVQEKQDGQAKKQVPMHFISEVLSQLHRARESIICCIDGLQKASALLPNASYHSTFFTTAQGHNKEQRNHMKSWKVGCRVE